MDFSFSTVSAEEHERLCALYEPLTQSLRRLVHGGIRVVGADGVFIQPARARDAG